MKFSIILPLIFLLYGFNATALPGFPCDFNCESKDGMNEVFQGIGSGYDSEDPEFACTAALVEAEQKALDNCANQSQEPSSCTLLEDSCTEII